MAEIKHHKVVASLPNPLEANSIYYVRVGQGYDQYVTNGSGTIVAYQPNVKLELDGKVDKEEGKGLSSNDFTTTEKNKLAGIEAGAQANTVDSVAGKTGDVALVKADVGLGNVDNTSDANKPISAATSTALNNKVDKVSGKQLSTEDFTTEYRDKLLGVEEGAQVNSVNSVAGKTGDVTLSKDDVGLSEVDNTPDLDKPVSSAAQDALDGKVDKVSGKGLSDENFSLSEKNKLSNIATNATANATDSFLLNRANHTGEQPISTVSGLQTSLDEKVDRVAGKGLSTNDFTDPLYDKLASLEGSRWKGVFTSLSNLEAGVPNPEAGDYADVDTVGVDVERYIWDNTDEMWVAQSGTVAPLTPSQIKQMYESNPDTNAFKDSEKDKLAGIESGAQVNSVTSVAGKTGNVVVNKSDVGLSNVDNTSDANKPISNATQDALDGKVDSQIGMGLSQESFTSQEKQKLFGIEDEATKNATNAQLRDRSTHTGTQPATTITGLADVATSGSYQDLSNTPDFGSAAFSEAEDFDPSGAASAAQAFSVQRSNHTGVQPISSVSGLQAELDTKVDKVAGKDLSTNDFTDTLKDKLEELENFDDSTIQAELDTKVDKVAGKELSDENYTLTEKNKLGGIEVGATANATDAQLRDRATHTGVQPITSVEGLQGTLDEKVEDTDPRLTNAREWTASVVSQSEAEAGTSTTARKWTSQRVRQAIAGWWNTSTFKTKLDGIEDGATKNATDAQLRNRATHTGVQPISSVTNLQSSLDSKVDKQSGYGLSQENYTSAEKSKLASIEGSKFKGEYVSLAALEAAQPSPEVGSYAYVDMGVGEVVTTYIWDSSDEEWVKQQGETASLTPAEVKSLYEENPDTNVFTDSEKTKLSGVQAGATANATDAQLRDRATHTGVQPISSVSGLQSSLDSKVDKVDGKELSSNDFTDTLKDKLEELENFDDSAIQAELANKADTTYVNTQLDDKVDKTLSVVAGTGLNGGGDLTTNRTLSVDSSVVRTSRSIVAGTGLSGGGNLSTDRTLNVQYGTTAGTAAQGNDSRLSNSREWSASTVSQSEAEAGTSTTRRAWTAQRVRQAIVSYFNSVTTSFTRTILGRSNANQVRDDLELGTAAIADADDFDPAGSAANAVEAHELAQNPHPQYARLSEPNDFTYMPTVQGDLIVESGSNSDGEWTRWADGTQICRNNYTLMFGYLSTLFMSTDWYYPTPFVDTNIQIQVLINNTGSDWSQSRSIVGGVSVYKEDITPLSAPLRIFSAGGNWDSGAGSILNQGGFAIGRWK